ncbi:signal transduction histidine kinase [Oxalobacteraceae bacterium GrIS 1.18]
MRRYPFLSKQIVGLLFIFASVLPIKRGLAADLPPLVFACDRNYPPVSYEENGEPKGLVVDILIALEKRIGQKIDIRMMEWASAQEAVLHGEAAALCRMSMMESRKAQYDFSTPVMTSNFSIFSRIQKHNLSDLNDLHGLQVGVTPGGLAQTLLSTDQKINTVVIDDYLQGFQLLEKNRIDAMVVDHWVGSYLLAENGITDIQPGATMLAQMPASIAVKKGNLALLNAVNQGLAALQADGTLDRIHEAWRPKEIIYETREHAKRKIYLYSLGVLVLLLIGAAAWVITMKREVAERVKSERELMENRERLVKLSAHIEYIKEQQRIRIAREIHDDLGGNLVAIKMVIHTIAHRSPVDPAWLTEKIQYIETLIDRTMEAGHRIVLELRPGVLDLSIVAAIEWLAKEFEKQNNIPCKFTSNSKEISILPGHAAAIFRMVQEALTNIAKHAAASNVQITILSTNDNVTFMISDDGLGLEQGHEYKPESFGLLGMQERCREIGGVVWLESKPQAGCVVTIRIPL